MKSKADRSKNLPCFIKENKMKKIAHSHMVDIICYKVCIKAVSKMLNPQKALYFKASQALPVGKGAVFVFFVPPAKLEIIQLRAVVPGIAHA